MTPQPGWDFFFATRDIIETTGKPEWGLWVRRSSCQLPDSDGHVECALVCRTDTLKDSGVMVLQVGELLSRGSAKKKKFFTNIFATFVEVLN